MAESNTPFVRLYPPSELPVRMSDWPEDVGMAVCVAEGRVIGLLPYHVTEKPHVLRRRLLEEAGERIRGFALHPPVKGLPDAKLQPAEDERLRRELETALRGMPRLIEEANDFAINYEFATEEGMTLDALSDGKGVDTKIKAASVVTEQLPVGYMPFVPGEVDCEVILGAILRPVGASGVDLCFSGYEQSRAVPPEAKVLVRDDSLRVAIPLGPVLQEGKMPPIIRLPAGSLFLGASGGKEVAALVLRRGGMLFVAPDHSAIGAKPTLPLRAPGRGKKRARVMLIALAAVLGLGLIGGGVWYALELTRAPAPEAAPVENLRSGLFSVPKE